MIGVLLHRNVDDPLDKNWLATSRPGGVSLRRVFDGSSLWWELYAGASFGWVRATLMRRAAYMSDPPESGDVLSFEVEMARLNQPVTPEEQP